MPSRRWLAVLATLSPVLAHATEPAQHSTVLLSPVASSCISSPFGPRVLPNRPLAGTYHYGVDMPAAAGEAALTGTDRSDAETASQPRGGIGPPGYRLSVRTVAG